MKISKALSQKHILMISFWDFQDEGMQVTQRTPLFFAAQGFRITFMVHNETTAQPSTRKVEDQNIQILRFDMPLKFLNAFHALRRVRQLILFALFCAFHSLKLILLRRRPDVIYAAEADAIIIGAFLRRILRCPFVARFYGVSRISAHYDFNANKLNNMGTHHLLSLVAMTRSADLAIITDDGSEGLEVYRGLNKKVRNIRFWRNGIDRQHIDPREVILLRKRIGLSDDDFVILTLCRLDYWKGVDRGIRALRLLVSKGAKNAKLIIVGHGSERINLIEIAKKEGIIDRIFFIGPVAHGNVYFYYALADVFLSLYRYSNVGNQLWEALSAGLAIITLNTAGTGKIIRNGVNGMLLKADDREEEVVMRISDTLYELFCDPGLRKKLAMGAEQYARVHIWTWEERLLAELQAILELCK